MSPKHSLASDSPSAMQGDWHESFVSLPPMLLGIPSLIL